MSLNAMWSEAPPDLELVSYVDSETDVSPEEPTPQAIVPHLAGEVQDPSQLGLEAQDPPPPSLEAQDSPQPGLEVTDAMRRHVTIIIHILVLVTHIVRTTRPKSNDTAEQQKKKKEKSMKPPKALSDVSRLIKPEREVSDRLFADGRLFCTALTHAVNVTNLQACYSAAACMSIVRNTIFLL
jgi:hypothetical protein